jgi:hypothetical protein
LIVWCPEHECAHYFLAQPSGPKTFTVHEITRGAIAVEVVKASPSGDMQTEDALDAIEQSLNDFDDDAGDDAEEDEEDED